jgi:hypothetical protein
MCKIVYQSSIANMVTLQNTVNSSGGDSNDNDSDTILYSASSYLAHLLSLRIKSRPHNLHSEPLYKFS